MEAKMKMLRLDWMDLGDGSDKLRGNMTKCL